jgi:hypothetical protein
MKNTKILDYLAGSLLVLAALPDGVTAQTLADFGAGSLTTGGTPATGERPLLVILMQYNGAVSAAQLKNAPAIAHGNAYFDDLTFNILHPEH